MRRCAGGDRGRLLLVVTWLDGKRRVRATTRPPQGVTIAMTGQSRKGEEGSTEIETLM